MIFPRPKKINLFVSLFLGVLFVFSPFSNLQAQEIKGVVKGEIKGRVVDKDMNPVTYWPITVTELGGPSSEYFVAVTDSHGWYQVFVPPGKYTFRPINQRDVGGQTVEMQKGGSLVNAQPIRFKTVVKE